MHEHMLLAFMHFLMLKKADYAINHAGIIGPNPVSMSMTALKKIPHFFCVAKIYNVPSAR